MIGFRHPPNGSHKVLACCCSFRSNSSDEEPGWVEKMAAHSSFVLLPPPAVENDDEHHSSLSSRQKWLLWRTFPRICLLKTGTVVTTSWRFVEVSSDRIHKSTTTIPETFCGLRCCVWALESDWDGLRRRRPDFHIPSHAFYRHVGSRSSTVCSEKSMTSLKAIV